MKFSILIPTVPSRTGEAAALFNKLSAQAMGLDVEILMLLDNKKRTVGKKREALVQISRGDYVAFVDDDDDVADNYVESIIDHIHLKMDVIVFDTRVTINGSEPVVCRHDVGYPNEQFNAAGFKRNAWQMHAWRGKLARATPFLDRNNGEDWPWCEQMLKSVTRSVKINEVLYHYRYNQETTEASK